VVFVPQNLEKGGLVMFRRMFKDPVPIIGKIVLVGFKAITVKTGIAEITGEIEIFVKIEEICSVL